MSKMTVMVAGCGALGNWVAIGLAGYGLKKIILVDYETIDLKNLNRQLVFKTSDIKKSKAKSLSERIQERVGEETDVTFFDMKISKDNLYILDDENIDVMFLCLDNVETRLDINEYCVNRDIPMVYGGTKDGVEGMVCTIIPGVTPCLRCFMEPKKDRESCTLLKEPSIVGTSMLISSLMLVEFQNFFMGKKVTFPALKYINNRMRSEVSIDLDATVQAPIEGPKDEVPEPFYYFKYQRDPKCHVCTKK